MAYIGFYFFMIGLAAAGGAVERGDSLIGEIAMTVAGAVLMWLYREESRDEKSEEDMGAVSGGSSFVDKPSGGSRGGCGENTKCGGGRDIFDSDNSILSWNSNQASGIGMARVPACELGRVETGFKKCRYVCVA